ncbi:hypothetical protein HaLaN_11812 [Haematococcus lacustris]|uniref:Uncharacterized protein n=1 Tax=Haematococcus lacustris TaxID=44745 RepID=A0A699Z210_HAELA|nr:hypothetical protein HaLaN_11812 [Haematococcus lacustris]
MLHAREAAGVINGFTTPLQFGTLGSVRNYITRVIQVNTLLGSIQRYLTPTSQLAAQRLLFDGIRLSINFVTTFPVAFLVYLSRIFLAARDLVQIPRDSTNIAISSLNLIVFISTNPVNCKRLLGVSEQFHELMAQLEAAGISTRDLLEEGAQPSFTTRDAPADVAPVAPLTRVLELSHLIVEMLSKVQEAGDAVIPDLESVLTMDDTYDFRERRFGGDPLAAVSQGMEEISRQVSGTAKALVFEVMRATGLSTVVDTTLGKPGADSPDGLCILPPITSVNRDNVGNGTNGLPPGVIGLPAVPQVGLPGLPFPAGFPATPPAFNPAVLNLLRTISTALGLAFSILNLAQTILEAISDILAVPPAGIALITGPILFEIISVDYYNQLVAAFPAVPNGYLTDLNTALGGIGARLTNPDNVYLGYQPLQAALGNLRSSLSSLGTVQGTLQGLVGDAA